MSPGGELKCVCAGACACVCACVRACACMSVCVYTGSGFRLPRVLQLHSGTETPGETGRRERERARRKGRQEGGERFSGRGRRWEIRESFSPLCHTRHPQPQRGLLSCLQEYIVNLQRNKPRSHPSSDSLALLRIPQRDRRSLGLLASRAKAEPAGGDSVRSHIKLARGFGQLYVN